MKAKAIASLAALLFAATARSSGDPCTSTTLDSELLNCQESAWHAEEAKLKTTYERALTETQKESPALSVGLEKSQHAWSEYRDAYCHTYAQSIEILPGSPFRDWWLQKCLVRITSQRSAELKNDFVPESSPDERPDR